MPISTAGGNYPGWHPKGLELFFLASDNRLSAAALGVAGRETSVDSITPLFTAQPTEGLQRHFCDVGPDGRFLISAPESPAAAELTLVVNWPVLVSSDR